MKVNNECKRASKEETERDRGKRRKYKSIKIIKAAVRKGSLEKFDDEIALIQSQK